MGGWIGGWVGVSLCTRVCGDWAHVGEWVSGVVDEVGRLLGGATERWARRQYKAVTAESLKKATHWPSQGCPGDVPPLARLSPVSACQ